MENALRNVKLTNQLLFNLYCPQSGPTHMKQLVNTRPPQPRGQIVAKPGNPLQNT